MNEKCHKDKQNGKKKLHDKRRKEVQLYHPIPT